MSSPVHASTPRLRPAGMPTFSGRRMILTASGQVPGDVGAVADEDDLDVDVLLAPGRCRPPGELGRAVAHREDDDRELHFSLREATMLTKCRPVWRTATDRDRDREDRGWR